MKKISSFVAVILLLSALEVRAQECYRLLDSLSRMVEQGLFQGLETLVPQAEQVCLAEVGDQDSLYADLLSAKGTLQMLQANFPAALDYYQQAKVLSIRTRGMNSVHTAAVFSDLGGALSQLGQFEQALAALDTSVMIKNLLHETGVNLGISYLTRGQIKMQLGRYAEAKSDLELSLENARKNNLEKNSYQYLTRISSLGLLLTLLGENREAAPILEETLGISTGLFGEENFTTITIMHNLALNYMGLNEMRKAEKYASKTLNLAEKTLPSHPITQMARINLAFVFMEEGRYMGALSAMLKVKEIEDLQHTLDPANYATLLNNIGTTYLKINDLSAAMPYLAEAREMLALTIGKNNPRYALANSNLATCHFNMGNTKLARTLAQESFDLIDTLGEQFPNYQMFLSNLATTLDDGEDKKILLLKAVNMAEKKFGTKSALYGASLSNYASCIGSMGRRTEALPMLKKALKIIESATGKTSKDYLDVLRSTATCYERLGEYKNALNYYQKAMALMDDNSDRENAYYAFLLQASADMTEARGKVRQAYNRFTAVDTLYHRLYRRNFAVLSDAGREAFLTDVRPQLDHWHSFAWRHAATFPEIPGQLLNDILIEKGQLLHSARTVLASLRSDSVLLAQMNRWLIMRQTIDHQRSLIAQNDSKALSFIELEGLVDSADLIESQLTRHSGAFEAAMQPVSWRNVQAQLAPDEAVVEFFHFNYYKADSPTDSIFYGALVLRRLDTMPLLIRLFEEKQLAAILEQGALDDDEWLKKTYPARSSGPSELYRLLWAPLEPTLKGMRRVWYAPSGLVHRVSLPAISKAQGERLVGQYDLQQMGSTRELATTPQRTNEKPRSSLILACVSYPTDSLKMHNRIPECIGGAGGSKDGKGNPTPLPGTLLEANIAGECFKKKGVEVVVKIGYEPLEDDFRKTGEGNPSPDVILITTHGFAWDTLPLPFRGRFPRQNPMYSSGLLLAGSEQVWAGGPALPGFNDGILTAREIGDMDLHGTSLAILSACKSGRGPSRSSEGVYGLQRAFKIAGTRQVLVTLWEIPDSRETAEFIGQFCDRWLESGDARTALFDTQKDFAKRGKPVKVWGAWVLI